jgi:vancomycin resistance protein VanJ
MTNREPALNSAARWPSRMRLASAWLSFALLLAIALCFLTRWDRVAVITLPPFWAWAVIGLLLAAPALQRGLGRGPKVLVAAWLIATLILSDDVFCLVRSPLKSLAGHSSRRNLQSIRVISLNCASQTAAAEETRRWKPDIVLLQESPASNDVARLCREWFGPEGDYLFGWDCSIIARGQIKLLASPRSLRFVRGQVRLGEGLLVDLASVRLLPPDTRFDLWSPECWRQHTHSRQIRRAQLQEVVANLGTRSSRDPMIAGGDFNAPAGDAIFRLLRGFLKDGFREAGRGWGNTAINTLPVCRPDQIWVSHSLRVQCSWVEKTEHSDHRMVISDLTLP